MIEIKKDSKETKSIPLVLPKNIEAELRTYLRVGKKLKKIDSSVKVEELIQVMIERNLTEKEYLESKAEWEKITAEAKKKDRERKQREKEKKLEMEKAQKENKETVPNKGNFQKVENKNKHK
jgi:hypothetical protein